MRPVHACAFAVLAAATGCSLVFGDNLDDLKKPGEPAAAPDAGGGSAEASAPDSSLVDGAARDGGGGAVCDGGPCGEPLAPVSSTLNDLKVTATLVVWSTSDGVYACQKASCATTARKLAAGSPTSLVIEDGSVFWANVAGTTVESCALAGCNLAPTVVRSGLAAPVGPASDGTNLYFSSFDAAAPKTTIYRCPRATCASATPQAVRTHDNVITSLQANAKNLLWVGRIEATAPVWKLAAKSDLMDGDLVTTSVRPTVVPPAVTAKELHFVQRSTTIFARAADEALFEDLIGTSVRTIATDVEPGRLAASDEVVAWTDTKAHAIYRCPAQGCNGAPKLVAKPSTFDGSSAIAVEGSAFVYASVGGMLVRFAL